MARARSGSAVKKGLKFFLYGAQGTKKSTFALDFMKMKNENGEPLRVFYLDTEFGSIDNYLEMLEDEGIDLANLFIVYANTYNEAEEWLTKAIDDEDIYYENDDGEEVLAVDANGNPFRADVICVDSITPIQDTVKYGMIKTSEKRAKLKARKRDGASQTEIFVAEATAGMEFKDYDKLQAKGKNLLRGLITRTNKYVCVVSREKDKKEQVKDSSGGLPRSVKVGVMPDAPKDAEYEFFTVLHMAEDEETGEVYGQIERKDRTLTFNRGELIENPSPLLWQCVIDGNKNKKDLKSTESKNYDEIVEQESNDQYSSGKTSSSKDNSVVIEPDKNNPDSIVDAIVDARNALSPSKKKALSANFSKAGLPKRPTTDTEIETLLKMLEIAKEMK